MAKKEIIETNSYEFIPADIDNEPKRTLYIPFERDGSGKVITEQWVSVNERTFLIKCGENVEVPESVYWAWQIAQDQKGAAMLYAMNQQQKSKF